MMLMMSMKYEVLSELVILKSTVCKSCRKQTFSRMRNPYYRTAWGDTAAVPVGGPPIRPLCLTPESLQQNDVAHMDTNGCACAFPYIIINVYIYMCILYL